MKTKFGFKEVYKKKGADFVNAISCMSNKKQKMQEDE